MRSATLWALSQAGSQPWPELVQRGDEAAHGALVETDPASEIHHTELGCGLGEREQQPVGLLEGRVATDG